MPLIRARLANPGEVVEIVLVGVGLKLGYRQPVGEALSLLLGAILDVIVLTKIRYHFASQAQFGRREFPFSFPVALGQSLETCRVCATWIACKNALVIELCHNKITYRDPLSHSGAPSFDLPARGGQL